MLNEIKNRAVMLWSCVRSTFRLHGQAAVRLKTILETCTEVFSV